MNQIPKGSKGLSDTSDTSDTESLSSFGCLKVSTQNLGDHIQIMATKKLLKCHFGIEPSTYVDRDNEISNPPNSNQLPLIINGWFKTNRKQWPPHSNIVPLFIGFHIRPTACPELLSAKAIKYYKKHQPIGCRDVFTKNELEKRGVLCYESNCLTITLPTRMPSSSQTKVFIVSRDKRLFHAIPENIKREWKDCESINHYTDTRDFESNMISAKKLLDLYRNKAKLVITTFLHCALPCIAMGIPVIVFYPDNSNLSGSKDLQDKSDRQRFSSLQKIIRIYNFNEMYDVNWNPDRIYVDKLKEEVVRSFKTNFKNVYHF